MLGAFGNGDRRTVGIIVGIRRILVVGLNTFQAFSNGNSNLAVGHKFRVCTDRLRAVIRLCGDGTAVNIYAGAAAGSIMHNTDAGLTNTGCSFDNQCTGTAVLPVNIKRCATHQIQGFLQVECCSFTKDQVQGFASGNTDKAFLIDGSLDHVPTIQPCRSIGRLGKLGVLRAALLGAVRRNVFHAGFRYNRNLTVKCRLGVLFIVVGLLIYIALCKQIVYLAAVLTQNAGNAVNLNKVTHFIQIGACKGAGKLTARQADLAVESLCYTQSIALLGDKCAAVYSQISALYINGHNAVFFAEFAAVYGNISAVKIEDAARDFVVVAGFVLDTVAADIFDGERSALHMKHAV